MKYITRRVVYVLVQLKRRIALKTNIIKNNLINIVSEKINKYYVSENDDISLNNLLYFY